jgi:hypothetical protein
LSSRKIEKFICCNILFDAKYKMSFKDAHDFVNNKREIGLNKGFKTQLMSL